MNFKNILITALCFLTATVFTACSDVDDEVKSLTFSRNFTPTDFKLQVTTNSTSGATISFGFVWVTPGNPENYVFEIYEGEEIVDGASPVVTLYPTTVGTKDDPFVVSVADNNLAEGTYIARIKAVGNNMEESRWTILEKTFKVKGGGTPTPQPVEQSASLTFVAGDAVATSYTVGCLTLSILDTDGKYAIDANTSYFGTETNYTKYTSRLKSGAKSSTKSGITIVSTGTGKLVMAFRTGSNSSDRSVVITKDGEPVASFMATEQNAYANVAIEGEEQPKNVYYYNEFNFTPGTYQLTYPDGSVNFYAFDVTYTETGSSNDPDEPNQPEGPTGNEGSVNFGEVAASVADGQEFSFGSASIKVNNTNGKFTIDANTQYFGDETTQTRYVTRMKSGGTSSDKNGVALTLQAKGKVTIAMRSSSGSADRTVSILDAAGTAVQTWTVGDSNAFKDVTIAGEEAPKTVFKTYSLVLEAGTYNFSYDGGLNFYGLSFSPTE